MTDKTPSLGGKASPDSRNQSPRLTGSSAMLHALANIDSDDPDIRERAIAVLGEVGDESVVKQLLDALKDANESIQHRAALALGRIGARLSNRALQQEVVDRLLIAALNAHTREYLWSSTVTPAITAIGFIGEPAAVRLIELVQEADPTILGLVNDLDTLIDWITRALAELDRSSVSTLTEALNSPIRQVRLTAVDALKYIALPQTAGPLLELVHDPDGDVREHVMEALHAIGEHYPFVVQPLLDLLLDLVANPVEEITSYWATIWTLNLLSQISEETAIQGMLCLLDSTDEDIIRAVLIQLREIKSPLTIPHLANFLECGAWARERYLCDAAADALREIETDEAQTLFEAWKKQRAAYALTLLQESHTQISATASQVLVSMEQWIRPGDVDELLPYVIQGLELPYEPTFSHAIEDDEHPMVDMLETIGNETAIPAIERCLFRFDRAPFVLAELIARHRDTQEGEHGLSTLLNLLEERRNYSSIISCLGRIGGPVVTMRLVAHLDQSQIDVSALRLIIRALGETGSDSATAPLLAMLGKEAIEPSVREDILVALGQLGGRFPDFSDVILEEIVSFDYLGHLCPALLRGLGELRNPRGLARIFEGLRETNPTLRDAAITACDYFVDNQSDYMQTYHRVGSTRPRNWQARLRAQGPLTQSLKDQIAEHLAPLLDDWILTWARGTQPGARICTHAQKVLSKLETDYARGILQAWSERILRSNF